VNTINDKKIVTLLHIISITVIETCGTSKPYIRHALIVIFYYMPGGVHLEKKIAKVVIT
jgi:hypothetical protein